MKVDSRRLFWQRAFPSLAFAASLAAAAPGASTAHGAMTSPGATAGPGAMAAPSATTAPGTTAAPGSAAAEAGTEAPAATGAGAGIDARSPGAEAEALPAVLRWPDVVALVDRHPALALAGLEVAVAEGRLSEARQVPDPELEAAAGRGVPRDGGEAAGEWSLGLTIPLDWLARRGNEIRAARAGVEASREEARALRREILGELGRLFWTLALDQARVATLEGSEEQAARIALLVRRRVESGEARPIELPRIETELEMVRLDLDAARAEARTHFGQLALWLGGDTRIGGGHASGDGATAGSRSEGIRVHAELEEIPALPELEALLARVGGEHPRLRAGEARVRSFAAAAQAEKRRRLPDLAAGGYHEVEGDRRATGAALRIGLPLWNRNRAAIARSTAERVAEAGRLEAARRELLAAAVEAHGAFLRDREAALRFRDEILPRAARAAQIAERTYQLGETGLLDALDARRVLLAANEEYLEALLALHLHRVDLSVLTGDIDDE